jgi:hypothetical protein
MSGRALLAVAVLTLLAVASPAAAGTVREAAHATTELDVRRAQELLADVQTDSQAVAFERARLAMYRGDCDTAEAILSAPNLAGTPDGARLGAVAQGCARAMAGAIEVHDEQHAVWIRLQDSRDRALVPFIARVAAASRDYLSRQLHVDLPRPLRIELVRDLFSLAAVTGLPVEAAETTGTVGVARFGRVVLVSPRATPRGYPWEDTLAHEIVHLFVTRASRDYAPLWLQEGIAKLHETGWREVRPFDDPTGYERVAYQALHSGRSVGIDGLGQSIALLPTPEMAATAYAEVTSFVRYWVERQGSPALWLLLADLRGAGTKDADVAMRSVSGFELAAWNAMWQRDLAETPPDSASEPAHPTLSVADVLSVKQVVRGARLGDLLAQRGHYRAAREVLGPAVSGSPREPSIRWRAARTQLALDDVEGAAAALGTLDDIDRPHGGWLALRARLAGDPSARAHSVALDPLAEDVACLGWFRRVEAGSDRLRPSRLPEAARWRDLCRAAREIPRD